MPQNFVDNVGPPVTAEFLNQVDLTVNQALQSVTTTAELIALVNQGAPTPGQNAIVLVASAPAIVVQANSTGTVSDFSLANGQVFLYNGNTDVTSTATLSIAVSGCSATINTGPNTPNPGPVGFYQFTALPANTGSAMITAVLNGLTYQVNVTISKAIAGSAGTAGPTGPTGPAGAGGILLVLGNPVANVLAYANGGVPSFAGVSGLAHVLNAGVDVSESATWSATGSGLTGTVNTADNVPVNGQPIGYYQVTAMTLTIATLTIQAVYLGNTLTAVFTVTQVPTGYQIVNSLPASGPALFEGNVVYLTTDGQLYRYHSGGWVVAVPAVNITGTITTTQITPGSITTPLLAANAVTAANIAANTITASQIAVGGITTNSIAAGAITAAKIGVTQLSAISANVGTITAGVMQNASATALLDLNNSWMVFNNGVNMVVRGLGFGASANYLEWFGPSQSSASNYAACTDALGIYWLKTDGTYHFGTSLGISATTLFTGPITTTATIPAGKSQMIIELFGDTGLGGHGDGSNPGGGGGTGGYAKSSYNISGQGGRTISLNLQQGNSQPTASTVSSGTFAITTMSAVGGTGGSVGAFGASGQGAAAATGGNLINIGGNDGGNANGTKRAGQPILGQYGNGNPGGAGAISASVNNPGLPALCYVTFL